MKNNKAKQIHIPKIKNQNKSYLALRRNALNHIVCRDTANNNRTTVVVINDIMNWNTNFHLIFLSNNLHVILSVFSLFFIELSHTFRFASMYRSNITANIANINSFHIQKNVQNLPSRHNWKVTKVCKKNCNKSQITKILHNKMIRNLSGFAQILDHR